MKQDATTSEKKKGFKKWLKRFGFAGFMFFFIKGLVWIAVFIAAYYGIQFSGC